MDYVYICRAGKNEELRYSIRSLVKNLPDVNVWVIGYKPDWYSGNFMSVPDIGNKFDNIYNALISMSRNDDISNDFVLMNDDFFVTDKMDSISVMHGGSLRDKIDAYNDIVRNSLYVRILRSTLDHLVAVGVSDPIDYDIHVPMPMNREQISKLTKRKLFPRSIYGNLANIGGQQITDVKTYTPGSVMSVRSNDFTVSDRPFISTEDKSFKIVYEELLKDMFTEPSEYERKPH